MRSEGGEPVQVGEEDWDLCNLRVRAPRGKARPKSLSQCILASAVLHASSSPDGSTQEHWCRPNFVVRYRPGGLRFSWFGARAGMDDCGGTSGVDCVVALAGVEGAMGVEARDFMFRRDLVEQLRCVTDFTCGELGSPVFPSFLDDPIVYLAQDARFRAVMLASCSLDLALGIDARTVGQQIQWAVRTA